MDDKEKDAVRRMLGALSSSDSARAVLAQISEAEFRLNKAYAASLCVLGKDVREKLLKISEDVQAVKKMVSQAGEDAFREYAELRFAVMAEDEHGGEDVNRSRGGE